MKKYKILAALLTTAMVFPAINTAADDTKSGAWESEYEISEAGYYDITAEFDNPSITDISSLYAYSTASDYASSVIPKTTDTNKNSDGYTEVMVRSVYADDGKITIGVKTDNADLVTETVSVSKSAVQSDRVFFNGGDISEYTYVKDNGGKYYDFDGTTEVDPIDFLAENGMNAVRIRLSNNPGKGRGDGNYYLPEGYQDIDDCISLGKKAEENNMTIEFTFNYSDYWSNGTRQIIPEDFADKIKEDLGVDVKDFDTLKNLTSSQISQIKTELSDIVYDYTKETMQKLKDNGIHCDYVSLGNEINGGMFFPFANTYGAYMGSDFELNFDTDSTDDDDTSDDIDSDNDLYCTADLASLGKILNAGYRAVKEVSPDSKVAVHFAGDEMNSDLSWILKKSQFTQYGETFDVIGISYYPAWSKQPASACAAFVDKLKKAYNKDVIIMETGFNFSDTVTSGYEGQLKSEYVTEAYGDVYTGTPEGHMGYMAEMINAMRNTDGCIGILYWDPLMIHVSDSDGNNKTGWAYSEEDDSVQTNVVENTAMFDFSGKATDTVKLYNDTKSAVKKSACLINSLTHDGADISKNTNEKSVLIFAGYDKDGVLTGIDFADSALDNMSAGETQTIPYDSEKISNGHTVSTVKAFIWDFEGDLYPICGAKEVSVDGDD